MPFDAWFTISPFMDCPPGQLQLLRLVSVLWPGVTFRTGWYVVWKIIQTSCLWIGKYRGWIINNDYLLLDHKTMLMTWFETRNVTMMSSIIRHDFAKWWKKLKLWMCQLGRGSGGRLGPQKLWGKWCKILHSRHFQALKITYGKHDFLYQILTLWNNYYLTRQYEFPPSLLPFCFIDT